MLRRHERRRARPTPGAAAARPRPAPRRAAPRPPPAAGRRRGSSTPQATTHAGRQSPARATPVTRPPVGAKRSHGLVARHRLVAGSALGTPASLCWLDEHSHARGADRLGGRRRHPSDAIAPALPRTGSPASTRSARRRAPRAWHPLDQDDRQGVRHRPRDPDGRPHHARGPGHPRQGARAVRQGDAPRPDRPDLPVDGRGLRLPRHGRRPPRRRSATAASRSPRSPPRSRAAARRWTSSSPTPATPSRPAPTRSTWSSTAARSSPAATSQVFDEIVAVREACADRTGRARTSR